MKRNLVNFINSMRRFADNIGTPCAIMLISSDVNFTTDLCDFKNRKNIHSEFQCE